MNLPPYPTQYKKYFDEIFVKEADDALTKAQTEYDQVDSSHNHIDKYIDIANKTIEAFVSSHADISQITELQKKYLSDASEKGIEQFVHFIDVLSELGDQMSVKLKDAQTQIDTLTTELEQAVSELTTDPLTNIMNRKGLINDLSHLIQAGQNKQLPIVLMMIDADNFKQLNDIYGHIAGDKVLYFLAQSIKSIIRGGDDVYRYGGEEFIVLLHRCDIAKAYEVADKIRSKIQHSTLLYNGKTINITVSIGVTVHRQNDSLDDFIARADEALYQAKQLGKNKTILVD